MKRSTANRIIAALTASVVAFSQVAYAAKSVNDLKSELAQNQKETEKIKKEIKEKQKDKNAATARMNELDMEIDGVQEDIDSIQYVIDEKQSEIDAANEKIDGLNLDIEKTKEKLGARLKVMYVYGSTSYLEIILSANSFSDLFTRINAVKSIIKHDNSMIDDFSAQITALEEAKAIVELEQQEQIEARKILDNKQSSLEKLRNEKNQIVKQLEKDIKELEKAEKQKESDANALQAEINRALNKSSGKVVYRGNGQFGWPSAASTRVTSEFGYRIHPIFGTKKLHRGMDIGAASGTDVLAAESGVVLTAGYNNSYGYYVTINHGSGYVTLYAHNSKLLVSSGQNVSRGQVIAKCGSTGNSTGPHIHFELQINGKLVNPRNYL